MPYKDPAKRAQALRDWRARNPEKQKAINDRARPREKVYRQANREHYAELQRNWRANNPRENLVNLARARAKRGNYPCTVTVEDIEWATHCTILGIELDYNTTAPGERKHAKRDAFATLDKKIPTLGYIPGNVFVISAKANRLKQDATVEQLQALINYMTPCSQSTIPAA